MAYRLAKANFRQRDDEETDVDDVRAKTNTQKTHETHNGAGTDTAMHGPVLLHKVQDRKSILTIVISNSKIFAGTQGGHILVWSLETYELLSTILAHSGAVLNLFLSRDGRLLFSSAGDAIVNVWCTQKLNRKYHIWSTYDVGDVFCVTYSDILRTVYLGAQNTSIQWHNLSNEKSDSPPNLESHPLNRRNKFFDSIGPGKVAIPRSVLREEILAPGGEAIEIDKRNIIQYAHFGYVYCMLLLKSNVHGEGGELLISGGGDGTIKLWQLTEIGSDGIRNIATLENGDNSILSMAFEGTFLYAGRLEGGLDVWDLDTCQLIRTVKAHEADVLTVAVSQELIFAGGSNGWAKRFDHRYKCQSRWKAHDQLILASTIGYHNEKAVLVTGGNDDCVAIWDIASWARQPSTPSKTSNEELLESLRKLVSYRTVSSNPENAEECRRGASWLRNIFKKFGASAEMLNTDDNANPIVLAKFRSNVSPIPKSNTILFYGHYDVVSADSNQQRWIVDPFGMQGLDGYLYGRGTSDNKGPMMAALYAVAELVAEKKLASDVIFLIEGEEECGSVGFQKAVKTNKHLIGDIDWILLANSYWLDDEIPCLTYGLRGIVHATVRVNSDHPDLHSGVEGSHMMDEALKDLVMLLATLGSTNGKVNIPTFYDKVLPITEAENRRYDAISQSLLRQNPDIASSASAEDLTASFKAKWREPSFTIHGFKTSGPANSTVIPHVASASISFRIVPDQEAEQIQADFVKYLRDQFATLNTLNTLAITIDHQADPWLGDTENQIFKLLERAIMDVWGPFGKVRRRSSTRWKSVLDVMTNGLGSPKIAPVTSTTLTNGSNASPQAAAHDFSWARTDLPPTVLSRGYQKPLYIREGGSIPAIRFLEKEFNAPAAHLPCGQASDNAHLDNERFRVLNLYNSREIFKKVFSESWS